MKQVKLFVLGFGLSIIMDSLFLPAAFSEVVNDCSPHCWNPVTQVQNSSVEIGLLQSKVPSEDYCKALCANNGTCTGAYWSASSTQCWYQMPATNIGQSVPTGINYWGLSNCTDDCLPFCWKAVENNGPFYGITNWDIAVVADENTCKMWCSYDTSCTGIDWVDESYYHGCWFEYGSTTQRGPAPIFRHWDIIRNLSSECHTTTCTCSTTNSSTSTSLKSSSVVPAAVNVVTWERTAVIVLAAVLGLSVLLNIGLIIIICIRGRGKPEEQWNEAVSDYQDILEDPRNEAESNNRDLPEVPRHEAKSNYHDIPEDPRNEAASNYNYQGLYVQENEFDNNRQVSDYADLEVDQD